MKMSLIKIKTKVFTAVLMIVALTVGQSAWAASVFTVESLNNSNTFRITREGNTAVEETIDWRVVSLSAIAGVHFTGYNGNYSGTVTFAANQTYKDVIITENTPGDNAYKYQNGTSRQYRFEVIDRNGDILASCNRSRSYGTSVSSSGLFSEKTGTITSGPFEVTEAGYNQNGNPRTINRSSFYNDNDKAYLGFLAAQLRMTLEFEAKEEEDGYQYLQVLFDNTTGYDSGNAADNGNPGTPSLSKYMAGFEIYKGSKYTTYKTYSFPVTSVGHDAGADDPWGYDPTKDHKFPLDKQKFNGSRADDGKLIVPNPFNTISVRFDASGGGNDDWWIQNLKAKITAVDGTAPTVFNNGYVVSGGRHQKGAIIYVSVPFSEIVKITGSTKKLTTTWGDLAYEAGNGSNVLSFKGKIDSSASGTLKIKGMSGTINDLANNNFSCPWTTNSPKDLGTALSEDYVWTAADFNSLGTDTYEIASKTDLRHLALLVNAAKNPCTGLTFQQTQDITCDNTYIPIGYCVSNSDEAMFRGIYDGNNKRISGITVNRTGSTEADSHVGVFGYCRSAIIRNVVLTNSTFTGKQYVGGIVGYNSGCTVQNCRVENTVTINAGQNYACYHGGIVGINFNSNAQVIGCYSAAAVSANGKNNSLDYGGIVGYNSNGTVKDCLYTGTTVETDANKGAIAGYLSGNGTFTNNYYTAINLAGVNGSDMDGARHAYTVTLGENIVLVGDETAYDVSGLTAIGTTALSYNDGTTTTIYSGATQTLTLNYTDLADGYTAFYSVNGEAIDGNTFQMPANDVTVNCSGTFKATYITHWQAGPLRDGTTSEKAYVITSPDGLQLLASEVNGGNKFAGKYFVLGSDIDMSSVSNFTPIGNTAKNYFSGNFNGQGNTIRHLTITQTGGTLVGLFGYLKGDNPYPVVSDLTLDGANISAGDYVGGIVGHQLYCSVSNCHVVSSSISGTATDAKVGAIAGCFSNTPSNSLSNCTYHSTLVYANSNQGNAFNIGCGLKGSSNTGGDSNGACLDNKNLFVINRPDLATLVAAYYTPADYTAHNGATPDLSDLTATIIGNVTLPAGSILEAQRVRATSGNTLTLEDGAQFIVYEPCTTNFIYLQKHISPFTSNGNGWNMITLGFTMGINLRTMVDGLVPTGASDVYDCFMIAQDGNSWENDKTHYEDSHLIIGPDNVRLYASSVETVVQNNSPQTPHCATEKGEKVNMDRNRWTMVGNPYPFNAYVDRPYYRMNQDGSAFELVLNYWEKPVSVGEGVLIKSRSHVVYASDSVYFTLNAPAPGNIIPADTSGIMAKLPDQHGLGADSRFMYLLKNVENNVDLIRESAGKVRNFCLKERTLYKDGLWNTLCLPFPVSAKELANGKYAGADIRTLSSSTFVDGTLTMNFISVDSIEAGKPYIIRWQVDPYIRYDGRSNENTCSDIAVPDFADVTVPADYADDTVTTDWVDFIGVTSPKYMAPYDTTKLILAVKDTTIAINYLWYPANSPCNLSSCRAFFQLKNGLSVNPDGGAFGDPTKWQCAPMRIVMNIDGESVTTDINIVYSVPESVKAPNEEENVKFFRNGQLYIRRAGITYDVLGRKTNLSDLSYDQYDQSY